MLIVLISVIIRPTNYLALRPVYPSLVLVRHISICIVYTYIHVFIPKAKMLQRTELKLTFDQRENDLCQPNYDLRIFKSQLSFSLFFLQKEPKPIISDFLSTYIFKRYLRSCVFLLPFRGNLFHIIHFVAQSPV